MIPVDVVEAAARDMHGLLSGDRRLWTDLTESQRDQYRDEARTVAMTVHPKYRPTATDATK